MSTKSTIAIVNPGSGSVPADGEEHLRAALKDRGVDADVLSVSSDDIEDAFRDAANSRAERVIVWGGDGTAACALSHLPQDGPEIILLPGGTMNLLHRLIFDDPSDWKTCLEQALEQGRPCGFPAGEVEGHRFFVALNLGPLAELGLSREALREGHLDEAAGSLAYSAALRAEAHVHLEGAAWSGGQDTVAAAAFLPEPDEKPEFEMACLQAGSTLDILKTAFVSWLDDWRNARCVEVSRARTFRARALTADKLSATIDGEFVYLPSEVEVVIRPNAARLMTARHARIPA